MNTIFAILFAILVSQISAFLLGSSCGCGGPTISLCGCTPRPRIAAPPFAPPPPPEPPLPPKCDCPPTNCYSCPPAPTGCGCGGGGYSQSRSRYPDSDDYSGSEEVEER